MWHNFSNVNPFRPPSWRWQRAGLAASGDLPISRRRDDAWVARAARFQIAFGRCRDPHAEWVLAEKFPDVFYAHQLFDSRDDDERKLLVHEVEARLLAGEAPTAIAHRAGMEAQAITAYETLFFNVADRLDQRSYIMHQVLGRSIQEGIRERQYDLIWKLFGWKGGPRVVDLMVETMGDLPRPEHGGETIAFLRDTCRDALVRKGTMAAMTLDASNGFLQTEILQVYLKLVDLETGKDGAGKGGSASIQANIEVMLNCIPFAVGNRPPDPRRPLNVRAIVEADDLAAELRGEELLELAAGRVPLGLDQARTIDFPQLPARAQHVITEDTLA